MTADAIDLFSFSHLRFNGATYEPEKDNVRLGKQLSRVYQAMKDGQWRTLEEIKAITGDGEASISAQLRHMRKPRFGGNEVNKRPRGDRSSGLYEYQLKIKT